jgi:hypothetical protein
MGGILHSVTQWPVLEYFINMGGIAGAQSAAAM